MLEMKHRNTSGSSSRLVLGITAYKLQHTNYSIQITAYKLQHTIYSIQITAYKLQHTNYSIQITAYKLQHTNYSIKIIAYKLQHTNYSIQILIENSTSFQKLLQYQILLKSVLPFSSYTQKHSGMNYFNISSTDMQT
jgi:hypothetical protein